MSRQEPGPGLTGLYERWAARDEIYRRHGGLTEEQVETIRAYRLHEADVMPLDDRATAQIAARKWEPPLFWDPKLMAAALAMPVPPRRLR